MQRIRYKIVVASIITPVNDKETQWFQSGMLVLKKISGNFIFEYVGKLTKEKLSSYQSYPHEFLDLTGNIIIPGFFDMHFHWVQDDVRLMPKDSLLNWLSKYTWPFEAKFKNKEYSVNKAKSFFNRLTKEGTIGGAVYASIHPHTVDHAFKYAKGEFVIGNVLMTMNSPKYLSQSKQQAFNVVKKLLHKYGKKYCLTPRFAPTTHPDLMQESSRLIKQKRAFIQTHLSETKNEIAWVLELYKKFKGFEKVQTYTDVYKKSGILGPRTIMGHGVYLADNELETLANTKTTIAHCPTSNAPVKQSGLGSGLFNFKKAEKFNIRWALGSDIGGGPFVSMIDVMNSFVYQNRKIKEASYKKALYRATLAGAQILKVDKKQGSLQKGKEASFLVLKVKRKSVLQSKNVEAVMKSIFSPYWKKRNACKELIKAVYYQGELVK